MHISVQIRIPTCAPASVPAAETAQDRIVMPCTDIVARKGGVEVITYAPDKAIGVRRGTAAELRLPKSLVYVVVLNGSPAVIY